jgi:hypothetical protein
MKGHFIGSLTNFQATFDFCPLSTPTHKQKLVKLVIIND